MLTKSTDFHWKPIRLERDRLLDLTDKYLVPDRLNSEQTNEILAYRQALRDLTKQCSAANQVVFPTPPSFVKELND